MGRPPEPPVIPFLVFLMAGPLIWAVHFAVLYGGHTLLCAAALDMWAKPLVAAATILAGLAILALLHRPDVWARRLGLGAVGPYRTDLARLLAALSGLAVLWGGATALVLTACVGGR